MGRQARQLSQNSRWKDGWKSFTIPATKWLNGWCSHDFFARVLAYYFGKINDFAVDWIYWSFLHVYLEYSEKGPFSHRTWRMESPGRWWNGLSSSFQTQLAKCGRTWRSVSAAKQMNLSSCHIILVVFDAVYSVAFSLQPPCCFLLYAPVTFDSTSKSQWLSSSKHRHFLRAWAILNASV